MIEWAETLADLEQARVALLGRKGEITGLMRMMGKIAPEERPILGKRANELRGMAEGLLEARNADLKQADMRARMSSEAVDITLPGARPRWATSISSTRSSTRSRTCSAVSAIPWRRARRSRRVTTISPRSTPPWITRAAPRAIRSTSPITPPPGTALAWQGSPRATSLPCRPKPVGPLSQRQPHGLRQRGRPGGGRVGAAAERALHGPACPEGERRGADGTGMHVKADAGRVQHGRDLL